MSADDWSNMSLGDLLALEYGQGLTSESRTGAGFPVFGSSGEVGRHASKLVDGPGIVVGRKGTVGSVIWSETAFWPIDTTYFVRLRTPSCLRWLYWRLATLSLSSLDSSTGVPGLNRNDAYGLSVGLPSVREQRRIAEILDTLDEAIRKTEQVIAKLQQMKQGLLHDLLTRGIDENGELRDPKRHPEQFKDSPLGRIPRAWSISPLGRLCRRITYGFTNPMPTVQQGPWMLTAADIDYDGICYRTARRTTRRAFDLLTAKSKPGAGDILVTKDGTLGRVALLGSENVCVNQSVAVLQPREGGFAKFLVDYLLSPPGQDAMLADAGGSTIKHLYITRLAALHVPVPPIPEACRITTVIAEQSERLRIEATQADKLRTLKHGLMDDLLTGSVRVPVPPSTTP